MLKKSDELAADTYPPGGSSHHASEGWESRMLSRSRYSQTKGPRLHAGRWVHDPATIPHRQCEGGGCKPLAARASQSRPDESVSPSAPLAGGRAGVRAASLKASTWAWRATTAIRLRPATVGRRAPLTRSGIRLVVDVGKRATGEFCFTWGPSPTGARPCTRAHPSRPPRWLAR